jgi:hypothetical protein
MEQTRQLFAIDDCVNAEPSRVHWTLRTVHLNCKLAPEECITLHWVTQKVDSNEQH